MFEVLVLIILLITSFIIGLYLKQMKKLELQFFFLNGLFFLSLAFIPLKIYRILNGASMQWDSFTIFCAYLSVFFLLAVIIFPRVLNTVVFQLWFFYCLSIEEYILSYNRENRVQFMLLVFLLTIFVLYSHVNFLILLLVLNLYLKTKNQLLSSPDIMIEKELSFDSFLSVMHAFSRSASGPSVEKKIMVNKQFPCMQKRHLSKGSKAEWLFNRITAKDGALAAFLGGAFSWGVSHKSDYEEKNRDYERYRPEFRKNIEERRCFINERINNLFRIPEKELTQHQKDLIRSLSHERAELELKSSVYELHHPTLLTSTYQVDRGAVHDRLSSNDRLLDNLVEGTKKMDGVDAKRYVRSEVKKLLPDCSYIKPIYNEDKLNQRLIDLGIDKKANFKLTPPSESSSEVPFRKALSMTQHSSSFWEFFD